MRSLLLLAVVCVLAAQAHALLPQHNATASMLGKDHCNGKPYGTSGEFDFYVFAQSWPAQFCQTHMDWPGCANPTKWQIYNMSLHGMWPNFDKPREGRGWPQCCPSKYGSDVDPAVIKQLLPQLQEYWANEQDPSGKDLQNSLWGHEWSKHGTCAALTQHDYFDIAMRLQLTMPTPTLIHHNLGGRVSLVELKKAFGIPSCVHGEPCAVGFQCKKTNGQLYLAGVTTCFNRSFQRILCSKQTLASQGQQCTEEWVYINSF